MTDLIATVLDLVSNGPPEHVAQLATSLGSLSAATEAKGASLAMPTPAARARVNALLSAWRRDPTVSPAVLSGMLQGASAAYRAARAEQEVEIVWTGPSTQLVPTRRTEQVLLEVVDASRHKLFVTSFVLYKVTSVIAALTRASTRNVRISMLLEPSEKDGGGVSVDGIATMRALLPAVRLLRWVDKGEEFAGAAVHAKVAVCDEKLCFVSSANLTGHAMEKNMEAGLLVRGGATPRNLHLHLEALETTRIVQRI